MVASALSAMRSVRMQAAYYPALTSTSGDVAARQAEVADLQRGAKLAIVYITFGFTFQNTLTP